MEPPDPPGLHLHPAKSDVESAVALAHRQEWALVLAATVRVTKEFDQAEECVQEAYASALSTWPERGVPAKPGAWLTTVARRRALDLQRRRSVARRNLPQLVTDDPLLEPAPPGPAEIPDDRLRLVFTCCHPALAIEAQVALSMRLLCGLTTAEVARAFLVSEATMAARITRAKKKIAAARVPYRIPPRPELPERIDGVLNVIHLVFNAGHTAPSGDQLVRVDLVERAYDLARMLRTLLPGDPDVAALLALILLTDARRATRIDDQGQLILLADQDRSRWDRDAIAEGLELVREALKTGGARRWALMAAIAAVHAESPGWEQTDWAELVALYDRLIQRWPSPIVALNRAVAIGLAYGPETGLAALDDLADHPQLVTYSYLAAARADFLRRLDRRGEAKTAYQEALMLTENSVERAFLTSRLEQLNA
jgi:RNA polymerase sigma factor (sigma-70 family)